jgi:hypothetical protein
MIIREKSSFLILFNNLASLFNSGQMPIFSPFMAFEGKKSDFQKLEECHFKGGSDLVDLIFGWLFAQPDFNQILRNGKQIITNTYFLALFREFLR